MRINNNLMAMNTHRQLGINANNGAKSIEKLSSGYRINRAGDDAAGLAISEKMRGQIRGLNQASRNSQDGISMIQTAEGALNETQAILQRMRELAVQSANDTNVDTDRDALQNEINELSSEITRIADTTEFNTQNLLDGSLDDIAFQIGANESQEMNLSINDMRAEALDVIDNVVELTEAGGSVEGIEADDDFDVSDISMTAVEGGAKAAIVESSGVAVDKYADDITMNFALGVSGGGSATLNGEGFIQLTSGSDINWGSINNSGSISGAIQIDVSGDWLKVDINVTTSGNNEFDISDAIEINADGTFDYSAHGVSFTVSAADAALISGTTPLAVDLEDIAGSGNAKNFLSGAGKLSIDSNYTNTASGTAYATFSGGIVTVNTADDDWLADADNITISGGDFTAASGKLTVVIRNAADEVLSTDTINLSGAAAAYSGAVSYDAHGISFSIDMNASESL